MDQHITWSAPTGAIFLICIAVFFWKFCCKKSNEDEPEDEENIIDDKNVIVLIPPTEGDKLYKVIDSGIDSFGRSYSMLKWTANELKPYEVNKFINCESKNSAYKQAMALGFRYKPLFHRAHEPGQKDHFHIYDHCYIQYDDMPDKFHNFHFQFGPIRVE